MAQAATGINITSTHPTAGGRSGCNQQGTLWSGSDLGDKMRLTPWLIANSHLGRYKKLPLLFCTINRNKEVKVSARSWLEAVLQ